MNTGIKTNLRGFALPTVMIASIVMLMLLLSGLTATSSINTSIRSQYHEKVARDAATAALNMVLVCLKNDEMPVVNLRPNSTSCSESATDSNKSEYLVDNDTLKSTFTVDQINTTTISGVVTYDIHATGSVMLYRTSNPGVPWKTSDIKLNRKVPISDLTASLSNSGVLFVCGIVGGKSYCWGRNLEGQLGNGTYDTAGQGYETDVATGTNNFSLGLFNDNKPVLTPVLRQPNTYGLSSPLKVDEIDLDIVAGSGYACNLSADKNITFESRKIVCWGTSSYGETTRAPGSLDRPFVLGSTKTPWEAFGYKPLALVGTTNHMCTIVGSSESNPVHTYCWGQNDRGQLGRGTTSAYSADPMRVNTIGNGVAGIGGIKKIDASVSSHHTCGLQSDNRVVCWGINFYGEIGDGTSNAINGSGNLSKAYPRVVMQTGGTNTFYASDIAAGGHRPSDVGLSCGIADNSINSTLNLGKIYCWGSNQYGQLGTGEAWSSRTHNRKATQITDYMITSTGAITHKPGYIALDVATNGSTVCAIVRLHEFDSRKDVICWGDNGYGELGIGSSTPTTSNYPRILSRSNFDGQAPIRIVGGASRFCAIAGNSNYCWGRDQAAQVGDGEIPNNNPVGGEVEWSPKRSAFLEVENKGITY